MLKINTKELDKATGECSVEMVVDGDSLTCISEYLFLGKRLFNDVVDWKGAITALKVFRGLFTEILNEADEKIVRQLVYEEMEELEELERKLKELRK